MKNKIVLLMLVLILLPSSYGAIFGGRGIHTTNLIINQGNGTAGGFSSINNTDIDVDKFCLNTDCITDLAEINLTGGSTDVNDTDLSINKLLVGENATFNKSVDILGNLTVDDEILLDKINRVGLYQHGTTLKLAANHNGVLSIGSQYSSAFTIIPNGGTFFKNYAFSAWQLQSEGTGTPRYSGYFDLDSGFGMPNSANPNTAYIMTGGVIGLQVDSNHDVLVANGSLNVSDLKISSGSDINFETNGKTAYFSDNISAQDVIDRTSIYDKTRGPALSKIIDADNMTDLKGEIDHSKFYGYTTFEVTDYERPVLKTVCTNEYDIKLNITFQECREIPTYPHTKTEEGVSMSKELAMLRQAVLELKQENQILTQRVNALELFSSR